MHRLKTCATINFIAVSPPLDGGGLFIFPLTPALSPNGGEGEFEELSRTVIQG
jgi:hypothetical protein